MTIARPRYPHLSPTFTSLFVVSIWSVSVMIATPTLLYSTTISYDDDNMETRQVQSSRGFDQLNYCISLISHRKHLRRFACLMVWPDGDPSVSLLDHYYQVLRSYFNFSFLFHKRVKSVWKCVKKTLSIPDWCLNKWMVHSKFIRSLNLLAHL